MNDPSTKTMKRPYQVAGALLLLFAVFMARESLRLQYYTSLGPGPGFFPFWVSLLLGLLAVAMFYDATFRNSDPMPEDFAPTRLGWVRMAAIVAALVGIAMSLEVFGFRLSVFAFLMFLLLVLGRQSLLLTLVVALAFSFGTFYVFQRFLKVPLPTGMFGF